MSKLVRIDANLNKIENPHGVDISVFANDGVEVENSAVDEAAALAEISLSCERLSEHDFFWRYQRLARKDCHQSRFS